MARSSDKRLVEDLILSCTGGEVPSEIAQKAVRAICRYYGGQMIYIPVKKENGSSAKNLRGIIADAVGDRHAEKILGKIMALYGNISLYIPMERFAFKKTIALEIYERSGINGITMNDLAREYGISLCYAYILRKDGLKEKLKSSMPYLPFLEMSGNTNLD